MKTKLLFILTLAALLLCSCGKAEKEGSGEMTSGKMDAALQQRVNGYFNMYSSAFSRGQLNIETLKNFLDPSIRETSSAQAFYSGLAGAIQSGGSSNMRLVFEITEFKMKSGGNKAQVYYNIAWITPDGSTASVMDTDLTWEKIEGQWYIVVD